MILALNVILDTYMYTGHLPQIHSAWADDLVFVPWTFIYTNIVQSVALFYGTHPFHWYISQGLPLMLFTFIPLTLYGLYRHSDTTTTPTTTRAMAQLVGWVVMVYSLLSHKEFRFLYPIFPLLMIFTAHGLALFWRPPAFLKRVLVAGLFFSQMALALYVSLWHQRGVMDVMAWLAAQPRSAGFLMPCHSTPWLSSLHGAPDPLWFLTCEPPLNSNIDNYLDQADQFYADPPAFLASMSPWPDTLVMFDKLLLTPGIKPLLTDYVECQRFFNSHVHWDSRRKGDVVVLCRKHSIA
jgi:phosphatidylinositol glycan class B